MSHHWEYLRELDVYPKPLEGYSIKTLFGGSVTVVSTILMGVLFISELTDFLTPKITEELFVDTSRSHKLRINLDIEFPRVACSFLSLDAMDSSGDHQTSIEHNIYKRRLNADGVPISEAVKTINLGDSSIGLNNTNSTGSIQKVEPLSNHTAVACGSCYGAETLLLKCCNTCEDVKDAYRLKGWALQNPELISQCKGMVEDMKKAFNEGCQIYGFMEVNRVSGSFHIAPGKSFSISHVHVHDVQPYSSSQFNMTHKIRSLSFGDPIPAKAFTNPMDGLEGIAREESLMFQYYLKIVPTMFETMDGTIQHTNQYSTSRHQRSVSMMSGESGMPGVFFSYEISPIMIKFMEKRKSFGHFATSVCAIVGGIFTVAGLLDAFKYKADKMLRKLG